MGPFSKKKPDRQDDGVIVLRSSGKNVCGGTDAVLDTRAPRTIESDQMTLFDVTSVLPMGREDGGRKREYVSAFAAPTGEGTFLFLEQGAPFPGRGERTQSWALVRQDIFPELTALVRRCDLARDNGSHSKTHGLPENFGGSICIHYADGERISVSNNQTPVLTAEEGEKIAETFAAALQGERVPLPPPGTLREIRFSQRGQDGSFTDAVLTLHEDGTGMVNRARRFDGPTVYEHQTVLDGAAVAEIMKIIDAYGVIAWQGLPDDGFPRREEQTMSFVFDGGATRTVAGGRRLPDRLRDGFFKLELAITR
ncbi:MAG: hypothetical protein IJU18_06625 [Oscillospiraceae bacterium]|nr:hypothetical protein [Oscillospiraceae bacterium]